MAAADVLLPPSSHLGSMKRKRSEQDLILSEQRTMSLTIPRTVTFDPKKHLNFEFPDRVWTMKEIGHDSVGVSPIAVSNPFPLFSEEAVKQMREEVLSDEVQKNCKYQSNLAASQLRGFAPKSVP